MRSSKAELASGRALGTEPARHGRTERVLQGVEGDGAGAHPGVHAPKMCAAAGRLVRRRESQGERNEGARQRLKDAVHRFEHPAAGS